MRSSSDVSAESVALETENEERDSDELCSWNLRRLPCERGETSSAECSGLGSASPDVSHCDAASGRYDTIAQGYPRLESSFHRKVSLVASVSRVSVGRRRPV